MVCATVCLTVVPSFSDTPDVSTIGHSSKTDRSRTPLFHVAQYGDGCTVMVPGGAKHSTNGLFGCTVMVPGGAKHSTNGLFGCISV